ncbi:MAG: gamma-glutamylcyclotransferase family protein [Pseudomonadota bacterium]
MIPNGPVSSGDLFVFYGLLKQGASGMPAHIDLGAAGEFLGPCRFKGTLHDLGGFPGVVDGETLCHGVRYRLDHERLALALDQFEDVIPGDPDNSLYKRVKVPLLDDRAKETGEIAWIYWYNQPVHGFAIRADGNWPLEAGKTRDKVREI